MIWFRIVGPERAVMQVREVANAVIQVSGAELWEAIVALDAARDVLSWRR